MTLEQYIYLNKIPTGSTIAYYNTQVLEYFNVDYSSLSVKEVYTKVKELTDIKVSDIKKDKIKINGKWFKIQKSITKSTFGQFIELESYLLDKDYLINNLHEVLSIYVRPRKWNWKKFRYDIEKWDSDKKEQNSKYLLGMDINDCFGLNVFFYLCEADSMKNIKNHYLNQQMEKINQMMK